jgi:ribosome-binding factor A
MLRDVQLLLDQECANELDTMVTFTDVEITSDLRHAVIFYSVLGQEEKKKQAWHYFKGITGSIRGQLGRKLQLKYTPEIRFEFDPSVEHGLRIERLLNEISQKNGHSTGNNI